jgi:3-oxoacyl-(acyl-carrier-protein) synthase
VGDDRECVWKAVQAGHSGVRRLRGVTGIPDDLLLGATVDIELPDPYTLKVVPMTERIVDEAVADAAVDFANVDPERFGCYFAGHMGDTVWVEQQRGLCPPDGEGGPPWWNQWFPMTACSHAARKYHLTGPRLTYSTACASSLVSVMSATRAIQDDKCDIALAGGADAIHPLFAAGFRRMRVLADDEIPERACRPFDRSRCGFVLGEGGAMLVMERLSHALARGARIYAEVSSFRALAEAHHVTGLSDDSEAMAYLISNTLDRGGLRPKDIGYISAHGTGTQQNDLLEMRGIRRAFGRAADDVCVSSIKSMLGHMINAAGGVELAITVLAMRDGFAPPTLNLTDPDPELTFDCLPHEGRKSRFQHALKLCSAFGGHLLAVALSRWEDEATGFAYPKEAKVA